MASRAPTQQHRDLAVASGLGEDKLLLSSMKAREELGRLFRIDLELFSTDHAIKLEDVLGTDMTLRMLLQDDKTTRYFHGYVSEFCQTGTFGHYAAYRATLRPWLWLLTRTADCRIFQDKKVPDIIQEVFRDHGFDDFEVSLSGEYRKWEYCVQYRETDFNFVSRLMENEGIYYYFKHENGKHKLVLCDVVTSHEPYPDYDEIPYLPPDADRVREKDHIRDWQISQNLQPCNYAITDFDFKKPKAALLASHFVQRSHKQSEFEIFDYPGEYVETKEGEQYVKVRLEELQSQYEGFRASGNVRGIASGHVFTLKGFWRDDQNDTKYLVTGVTHTAKVNLSESGGFGGEGPHYSCDFECCKGDTQFRSARTTPKPIVQGPQTAIVVGKKGEEIWTDEFGRVKVKFPWDRYSEADEKSSCWIRVAQVWAGKQWGGIYTPRIGQEVIVEFLEGDPDRPIVTGRVYNGDAKVPYELPANKTQSTLKSNSSKGGGGFNEIRFEDKKDSEQIFVHAQKNQDNRVGNDSLEFVGNDRHLIVKNDRFEHIENNEHLLIDADQMHEVTGEANLTVGSDRKVEVQANDHLKVATDQNVEAGGDTSLKSGMNHNHKIGMKYSVDSGMDIFQKAGMNIGMEAGMAVHIKGGMTAVIEAGMGLTIKAGSSFVTLNPGGVFISGPMVMLNSGGAAMSGSGCSPQAPAKPEAPDVPEEALEADSGKPGGVSKVKAKAAKKKKAKPSVTKVGKFEHPQAQTLAAAAESGTPFCEECEAARAAQAGG